MLEKLASLKRVWCHYRGHQPLTQKTKNNEFHNWTHCTRCHQLLVRGYDYHWQRANPNDVAAYERLCARISANADPTEP
jgi:hypothetical protein